MRDETHAATRKFPSKKQTRGSLSLVSIEALGAALAPVAHLAVLHGDAPVGRDALSDASAAVRGDFQVLRAHLPEGLDVRAQRLGNDVVQVAIDPAL
jgi:hypothetical protein